MVMVVCSFANKWLSTWWTIKRFSHFAIFTKKNNPMKKIINFRPIFFCFIAFALSIYFAHEIFLGNLLCIIFFATLILSLLAISLKRKTMKNFLVVCLCVATGFCAFFIDYANFQGNYYEGQKTCIGRVSNLKTSTSYQTLILENVKIDGKDEKNISLFVFGGDLSVGDEIEFVSEIETINQFSLGQHASYAYKNRAPYSARIEANQITKITHGKVRLDEKVRIKCKSIILSFMPKDTGNLAYSMIFGDKTTLSNEISQSFRLSGISHALSVSGLHVGFLIVLLNKLIGKVKVKKYVKTIITSLVLLFYAYLCDFSPSVVRASIMGIVISSSGALGKQYDLLNSASLSGMIILLLNPLSIFDAGFQLSFMSVFCISTLTKPCQNLLRKIHIPKFIASSLALTFSVQLGILPIMAKYYSSFSLLSFVTNFVCIPLFEIAFILVFSIVAFALVINQLGFFLAIAHYLLKLIISISNTIASIDSAIVEIFSLDFASIVIFYVIVFVLSGFVMLKSKQKLVICCVLAFVCAVYSTIINLPKTYNDFNIMQVENVNSNYTIIISNQKTMIVGDFIEIDKLELFLKRAKIGKIDYIVQTSDKVSETAHEFAKNYNVENFIFYQEDYEDEFYSLSFLNHKNEAYALSLSANGYKCVFLIKYLSNVQYDMLLYENPNINFVVDYFYNDISVSDVTIFPNGIFSKDYERQRLTNFAVKIKNGEVKKLWNLN